VIVKTTKHYSRKYTIQMQHFNINALVHTRHVYVAIKKRMYGLPQAGCLANDQLIKHLSGNGYHQSENTTGLFTHTTLPIAFCLVVDDFFVKYTGESTAEHSSKHCKTNTP
jgi:hypothetical protein